jgi:hypothetical protein
MWEQDTASDEADWLEWRDYLAGAVLGSSAVPYLPVQFFDDPLPSRPTFASIWPVSPTNIHGAPTSD